MKDPTNEQQQCIAMLEEWACGAHHLSKVYEFGNGVCVNYSGDLSTHDFDRLTRLVLLAHRDAVRIEISSSGPGMVKIIAHKRKHGARKQMKSYEWHPSLGNLMSHAGEMAIHKKDSQ